MRLRQTGLGGKLNLWLLVFFIALGVATSAIVVLGFNRTQHNATDQSEEALEELGKLALQAVVSGSAEQGGQHFTTAGEIGQRAALHMATFETVGASTPSDSPTLAVSDNGLAYDPDPDRISDVVVLPGIDLESPAVLDELRYSASLDVVFEGLLRSFGNEDGGNNFDASAISFLGVEGTVRYYPPRGLHELVPPDLDISPLFERMGPDLNPNRETNWGAPYEDSAGQGLVVTSETPVYEGDTYRGVIQMDLVIQRLAEQFDSIEVTPHSFAFYMDQNGSLIRSGASEMVETESETNVALAAVLDAMRSDQGPFQVSVEKLPFEGEDYFFAYAPMPSLGGAFAVAAPVAEITEPARGITAGIKDEGNRTLGVMLAALGTLLVGGLVTSSYLNRRVLLSPIAELLEGTRAVGAGDLESAIPVRSSDELGALAAAFNQMTTNLNESENRYKRIFESATDGLAISRLDGTIVEANPAACQMHGYDEAEFLAIPVVAHIAPESRDRRDEFIAAIREGRSYSGRAIDVRKDGSRFDVDVRTIPFHYQGEPHFLSILRDVTSEVQAEQILEDRVDERTSELRLLLEVSQNVAATLNLEELARRILDQLLDVLPYGGAGVMLFEGDDLVMLDARDASGARDESIIGQHIHQPVPGPAGEALEQRAPVVVVDALADPEMAGRRSEVPGPAAEGRSWLATPLIAQDRLLGLLTLWSPDPDVYDAQDAELAMTVANQAAIAIENARLFQRASTIAALEERQRLARELHDSVSQALYGIALGAQTARQLLDVDPDKAIDPVEYVLSLAEAGLAEMRALIFELRPESLATEGLVSALEKAAAATQARYGVAVTTTLPTPEPDAPIEVKESLYRIAQEAMHNTVKHARATTIAIRLAATPTEWRLEVNDDGIGFDATADFPGHLGLQSMRERISALGGTLTVESGAGTGTRISATVPIVDGERD